jgi:hypothetical protein
LTNDEDNENSNSNDFLVDVAEAKLITPVIPKETDYIPSHLYKFTSAQFCLLLRELCARFPTGVAQGSQLEGFLLELSKETDPLLQILPQGWMMARNNFGLLVNQLSFTEGHGTPMVNWLYFVFCCCFLCNSCAFDTLFDLTIDHISQLQRNGTKTVLSQEEFAKIPFWFESDPLWHREVVDRLWESRDRTIPDDREDIHFEDFAKKITSDDWHRIAVYNERWKDCLFELTQLIDVKYRPHSNLVNPRALGPYLCLHPNPTQGFLRSLESYSALEQENTDCVFIPFTRALPPEHPFSSFIAGRKKKLKAFTIPHGTRNSDELGEFLQTIAGTELVDINAVYLLIDLKAILENVN